MSCSAITWFVIYENICAVLLYSRRFLDYISVLGITCCNIFTPTLIRINTINSVRAALSSHCRNGEINEINVILMTTRLTRSANAIPYDWHHLCYIIRLLFCKEVIDCWRFFSHQLLFNLIVAVLYLFSCCLIDDMEFGFRRDLSVKSPRSRFDP